MRPRFPSIRWPTSPSSNVNLTFSAASVDIGIDLYAYVTLTSPTSDRIADRVRRFVDRLQTVHENLPLRTVPLEIQVFAPVHSRVKQEHREALKVQQMAVEAWCRELEDRYSWDERTSPVTAVPLTE